MEVEEKAVEVVDLATTKVPYSHYQEYIIKLRPFSAPCLLKLQLASNEYRNFEAEGEGGLLKLMCRINHGHMREPSLSIRMKKAEFKTFVNRMLCRYNAKQQKELLEALAVEQQLSRGIPRSRSNRVCCL